MPIPYGTNKSQRYTHSIMAKNNTTIELVFTYERETKNCIRFTEVLQDKLDTPQVGTLYLQKASLKAMGWSQDKDIKMTLSVK